MARSARISPTTAGELVAMARARRGNDHLLVIGMMADDEVMVGRQRVPAGCRLDEAPDASDGMHGAQRGAQRRLVAIPRPEERHLHPAVVIRRKAVELNAVRPGPRCRSGSDRARTAAAPAAGSNQYSVCGSTSRGSPSSWNSSDAHGPGAQHQARRLVTRHARCVTSTVPAARDSPALDALVEMQMRAVIRRHVEVGANRLLRERRTRFAFVEARRFPGGG